MRIVPYDEFKQAEFEASWKMILEDSNALGDIGNSYEWNKCWWDTYKNSGVAKRELFVLSDDVQGKITAIWPLFIRHRYGIKTIHWIGQADGMITDYMAPVLSEQDKDKKVFNFFNYLSENISYWDVVDLKIPQWTNLLTPFIKYFVLFGKKLGIQWQLNISDNAVVVDLPADFETYLSQLGKNTKKHVKQYLRGTASNDIHFEIYKGTSLVDNLPKLFELSSKNWRIFQADISRKFLLNVAGKFSRNHSSLFLACLSCEEKCIATVLAFEKNDTCYIHPAGILRKQISRISPGTTMYALLIQSLIERGFKKLDLSPGLEEYKLRLGGHIEPVYQFLAWHKSSKINRWRMFDWLRKKRESLMQPKIS